MRDDYLFTTESVTAGHPDKLCDRISDAIVGRVLRQDPLAHVVSECAVSTGLVFVSVKLAAAASLDIARTARDVIRATGYASGDFDAASCTVMTSLNEAPREDRASNDVASRDAEPARDQVTLFGFACRQTPALLPLPVWLSHKLAMRLSCARTALPYLTPDGKTQVGVLFRHRTPVAVHSVTMVVGQNVDSDVPLEQLREDIKKQVIVPAFADEPIGPTDATRIAINPEGQVIGNGPARHAGLTGRKTADDTYGQYARHGAAALSGKDPSRIDRTGAYAARHAAVNVVAAGLADECEVMLSYSIGLAEPVSVEVEAFGTHHIPERELAERVRQRFDFRPGAIERRFGLRTLPLLHADGFYAQLAAYGHVGRPDLALPWEDTSEAHTLL